MPCKILAADISREGKLQLTVRRDPHLRREDVTFGIVVKPEAGIPMRYIVPHSKATMLQEDKGVEVVQLDSPIAGNSEVVVQLRARNEILESTRLYPGIASPRLRCHAVLDPNQTHLERALLKEGGTPFVQAVAMLLHLAGFKVEISAELERLSSTPYADLLAFTVDEKTVVIGSCVFRNPKPQDVTLLSQSCLTTKEILDENMTRLIPIIFTADSGATLPQSLQEQAQREMLRICSREHLLKALDMVRSGAGPDALLQVLQGSP